MLLILAGVSIVTLTGDNGLLTRTTTAKQKTEVAGIQEELQTAIEALKIDYHTAGANGTIGAYISNHESDLKSAVGDSTLSVNGNKITYKGQQFTIDDTTGKVTNSGVATATITWTYDSENDVITDGTNELKVGDYVNYNPMSNGTEGTTYTSYSLENVNDTKNTSGRTSGYSSNQVFDANNYVQAGYRWRVLDIKNGNIRLISEEPFGPGSFSTTNKTTYYLSGQQGYINGENELKAICSIFGHGKGAASSTSVTADDILEITGYNPSNPKYNAGQWGAYGSTVTYTRGSENALSSVSTEKDSNNNNLSWSGTQATFNYYNGTTFVPLTSGSTPPIESTYYYHDFRKDPSSNSSLVDSNGMLVPKYELLIGKKQFDSSYNLNRDFTGATSPYYWLASPYAYAYGSNVNWGLRHVYDGYIYGLDLYYSGGDTGTSPCGVRPVVSLQSDIQLTYGGSANAGWNIQ